jgi:hypothetical protein
MNRPNYRLTQAQTAQLTLAAFLVPFLAKAQQLPGGILSLPNGKCRGIRRWPEAAAAAVAVAVARHQDSRDINGMYVGQQKTS